MITSKLLLVFVAMIYMVLAIWCSVAPTKTSQSVGFEVRPGTGQSEFLVIYGGLELGLAVLFLLPLWRTDFLLSSLIACTVSHACLVIFRTASFFLYSDIATLTYRLAIGEWAILILATTCLIAESNTAPR